MRQYVIYDRDEWIIQSTGNGLFYTIRHALSESRTKSVFLQGDDADRFREEAFDDDGWLIEGSVAGMPRLHCLLQEYLPVMQSDACEPPREQERPET